MNKKNNKSKEKQKGLNYKFQKSEVVGWQFARLASVFRINRQLCDKKLMILGGFETKNYCIPEVKSNDSQRDKSLGLIEGNTKAPWRLLIQCTCLILLIGGAPLAK